MFGGFGLGVDGVAFRKQPHEPLCIKGPPDRAGAERWVKAFLLTFVFFPFYPWHMKDDPHWTHPRWKPVHWYVSFHDGNHQLRELGGLPGEAANG